jgi:CheY-like chemotaxis protein
LPLQVTGNATTHDAKAYADMGFNETLGKPFTLEALRKVLAQHATGDVA